MTTSLLLPTALSSYMPDPSPPIWKQILTAIRRVRMDPRAPAKYYDAPTLSDVTICFGDKRIHAHKVILCMASDYFKSAFTGPWKESGSTDFPLHGDNEEALDTLLRAMYAIPPDVDLLRPTEILQRITRISNLFSVSGKYQVDQVMEATVTIAKEQLLRCRREAEDKFCGAIQIIYQGTPAHDGSLRAAAREICQENSSALMIREDFEDLMRNVPDLAVDWMIELAGKEKRKRKREREDSPKRRVKNYFRSSSRNLMFEGY